MADKNNDFDTDYFLNKLIPKPGIGGALEGAKAGVTGQGFLLGESGVAGAVEKITGKNTLRENNLASFIQGTALGLPLSYLTSKQLGQVFPHNQKKAVALGSLGLGALNTAGNHIKYNIGKAITDKRDAQKQKQIKKRKSKIEAFQETLPGRITEGALTGAVIGDIASNLINDNPLISNEQSTLGKVKKYFKEVTDKNGKFSIMRRGAGVGALAGVPLYYATKESDGKK